jgi:hypothetical protein
VNAFQRKRPAAQGDWQGDKIKEQQDYIYFFELGVYL